MMLALLWIIIMQKASFKNCIKQLQKAKVGTSLKLSKSIKIILDHIWYKSCQSGMKYFKSFYLPASQ